MANLDFESHLFLDDPYPTYAALHETGGIYRCSQSGFIFLGHYESVKTHLRNPALTAETLRGIYQSWPQARRRFFAPAISMVDKWLLFRGGNYHSRLRRVMNGAFSASVVTDLVPYVGATLNRLLDGWQSDVDVVRELAYPLPVLVMCKLLDVPDSELERIEGWSKDMVRYVFGTYDKQQAISIKQTALESTAFFRNLLQAQRRHCTHKLYENLFELQAAEPGVTDEHLIAQLMLLIFAGHETTMAGITNSLLLLISRRDEVPKNPELLAAVDRVVEECLRLDNPIQRVDRLVQNDLVIRGVAVAKGSMLRLLVGAANHDPETFERPLQFDLGRANWDKHLSFGYGPHFCIGSQLAKMQLRLALTQLLERYDLSRFEVRSHAWRHVSNLRGPDHFKLAIS